MTSTLAAYWRKPIAGWTWGKARFLVLECQHVEERPAEAEVREEVICASCRREAEELEIRR